MYLRRHAAAGWAAARANAPAGLRAAGSWGGAVEAAAWGRPAAAVDGRHGGGFQGLCSRIHRTAPPPLTPLGHPLGAGASRAVNIRAAVSFVELRVPSHFIGKLAKVGITQPTEVQAAAIPKLQSGADMLLQWVTGSGKTLAYLLPGFAHIDREIPATQMLIIVPTRELAVQVHRVAEMLTRHGSPQWKANPITVRRFAGPATESVIKSLYREGQTHVVVATPPVAKVLIDKGLLPIKYVKFFVLDEADKLLEPEAEYYTRSILKMMNAQKRENQKVMKQPTPPTTRNKLPTAQHVYVSATLTDDVKTIANTYMAERQRCMDVGEAEPPRMPDVLRHFYVHVAAQQLPHHLLPKLHAAVKPIGSTVVFTRDVDHAREVVQYLRDHRFRAAVLTPAIPKERRERAALLRKVKRNQVKMLVTTEMASRGLDLPRLSMCVNLAPPPSYTHYLHRAGRLGRIHTTKSHLRKGTVITLVSDDAEAAAVQQHAVDLRLDLSRGTLESGELQYPGKAAELAAREKLNGERIAARARGEAEASSDEEDALSADEEGDASGERDEAVKSVSEAGGEKKSKRKGKGGRKGGRNKGNVAAVA